MLLHQNVDDCPACAVADLSDEAAEHGDLAMVAICNLALAGDAAALRECRRVIAYPAAAADVANCEKCGAPDECSCENCPDCGSPDECSCENDSWGLAETYLEITPDRIEALRSEAAERGDLDLLMLCDDALAGSTQAQAECMREIQRQDERGAAK